MLVPRRTFPRGAHRTRRLPGHLLLLCACACGPEPDGTPSPTLPELSPSVTDTPGPDPTPSPRVTDTPPTSPTRPPGTETPLPDPGEIPRNTQPCRHPEYWPRSLRSTRSPILIHFQYEDDRPLMEEVLEYLEISYEIEMDVLGFTPPLPDAGYCGPDDAFDVFIWPEIDTCYVNVVGDNPDTEWNDYYSYMVLDAWGEYAGSILDATLAHELNHASQAADDWWDSAITFEMTSTFIEDAVFDEDDGYMTLLEAFQSRPDWSLDRNDYYLTWYMYGASMTLFFIRDRYFDGDSSWTADLWRAMRNPPGADQDPTLNEPDFEDALEDLLQDRAHVGFLDAVLELARWRWFTGSRDDGHHFEEGALFPPESQVASEALTLPARSWTARPAPMVLGMSYLDLVGEPDGEVTLSLSAQTPARARVEGVAPQDPARTGAIAVEHVVQAVPGLPGSGTDGELLPGSGPWTVKLLPDGTRTLVVTVLPAGAYDPDTRTDDRYPFELLFQP